jgi:hypothetical protein
MKWSEVVPVGVSVLVILSVAILQKQSKLVAAVTATMPVTIPLALWIVYSSNQGERAAMEQFTQSLVIGIVPTVAFVLALWLASRLGLKLVPMIAVGYGTWATVLAIIVGLRRVLGKS